MITAEDLSTKDRIVFGDMVRSIQSIMEYDQNIDRRINGLKYDKDDEYHLKKYGYSTYEYEHSFSKDNKEKAIKILLSYKCIFVKKILKDISDTPYFEDRILYSPGLSLLWIYKLNKNVCINYLITHHSHNEKSEIYRNYIIGLIKNYNSTIMRNIISFI